MHFRMMSKAAKIWQQLLAEAQLKRHARQDYKMICKEEPVCKGNNTPWGKVKVFIPKARHTYVVYVKSFSHAVPIIP